jgi:DNA polymerase-3 subunit gamma/tau
MMKDWQAAAEGGASKQEAAETLQLEPEDGPVAKPEWVEEAYKMFGDQLVELKAD